MDQDTEWVHDEMPDEVQRISMIVAEVREFRSVQAQISVRQDRMETLLGETIKQQNQTGLLLATLIEQAKQHGNEIERANDEIKEIKERDLDVAKLLIRQEERIRGIWLVVSGAGSVILLIISAIAGHYIHYEDVCSI
jgi:hypothetical protein